MSSSDDQIPLESCLQVLKNLFCCQFLKCCVQMHHRMPEARNYCCCQFSFMVQAAFFLFFFYFFVFEPFIWNLLELLFEDCLDSDVQVISYRVCVCACMSVYFEMIKSLCVVWHTTYSKTKEEHSVVCVETCEAEAHPAGECVITGFALQHTKSFISLRRHVFLS